MNDAIGRIRHFNREITRRIGALDSSFQGCGVSLGMARLLYEIRNGVSEVRQLRAGLGLDSGQMSRLLRSLERRGLVTTSIDLADARVRNAALTRAGRAKLGELERKADEGARSWLEPLGKGDRARLQAAMAEVVRLLQASELIGAEDRTTGDAS